MTTGTTQAQAKKPKARCPARPGEGSSWQGGSKGEDSRGQQMPF